MSARRGETRSGFPRIRVRGAPRALAVALVLPLALAACQRSGAYRKDQDYYPGDGESYYDRQSGDRRKSTDRFDQLGQPRKRLVVLDFWNDTPVAAKDLGSFAADELRRELFVTKRLILPTDLKPLATEQFIDGERVKVAQLIREGRRMGVAVLAVGRIARVVFRQRGDDVGLLSKKQSLAAVEVEVKIFDVAAGRELMAVGKSGEAVSNALLAVEGDSVESPHYRAELTKLALRDAASKLVPEVLKAIDKLTWQGSIAKIAGNRVYVNAGKASGLVAGDILKVLTQGDDIYDPGTGAYLGRTQGQLKGTLEVVDFLGTDGAVSVMHTGGNFQEGDLVQLY